MMYADVRTDCFVFCNILIYLLKYLMTSFEEKSVYLYENSELIDITADFKAQGIVYEGIESNEDTEIF